MRPLPGKWLAFLVVATGVAAVYGFWQFVRLEAVPSPAEMAAAKRSTDWGAVEAPIVLEATDRVAHQLCASGDARAGKRPSANQIAKLEARVAELAQAGRFPQQGKTLARFVRQYVGAKLDSREVICLSASPLFLVRETQRLCNDARTNVEWRERACSPDAWLHEPFEVLDGGPDVWRVIYDPEGDTFFHFHENGSA